MKTYKVHDKAVVVILSKAEAAALYQRTLPAEGVKKSKVLLRAAAKLQDAIKELQK